jgi:hypothetical protein
VSGPEPLWIGNIRGQVTNGQSLDYSNRVFIPQYRAFLEALMLMPATLLR